MTDFKSRFDAKIENKMNRLLYYLRQQALNGKYIYRGEPENYQEVSSSLYRQYEKREILPNEKQNSLEWQKQMWELQKDIVIQSRKYLPGRQKLDMYERNFWDQGSYSLMRYIDTEEYEILCQLQHYGGATNLIDFTIDHFVALFFACEKRRSENGCIILSEMTSLPVRISDARVQAQKSVFVQVPNGFVESGHFRKIEIEAELKIPLLLYLKQCHAISSETLFPDVQGAIRHWNANQSVSFRMQEASQKNTQEQFCEAIEIYNECISLSLELDPWILVNRSISKFNLKDWQGACDDLTSTIAVIEKDWRRHHDPTWGFALFFRGMAHIQCQNLDEASQDLNAAKEKNFDTVAEFQQRFKCIADLESELGFTLPDDIKSVLSNRESDSKA